jgi:ribosomal protein L19
MIREGNKQRVQVFEGVVIRTVKKKRFASLTVRKIAL